MMFKVLNFALVLFGSIERIKGAQVFTLMSFGVYFS